MASQVIYVGPFASEWNSEFLLLKHLLDEHQVAYSVFGRNDIFYESDYKSGIKIVLPTCDYEKMKQIVEEYGNEKLKEFINTNESKARVSIKSNQGRWEQFVSYLISKLKGN